MENPGSTEKPKIVITLLQSRIATVWNKLDVIRLKQELRIPGNLIGSLPRKPWQNQVMSLPLLLSPEEVSLLIEKGFAVLKRSEMVTDPPKPEVVESFKNLREKSHYDQISAFVEEREKKRKMFKNEAKVKQSTDSDVCTDKMEKGVAEMPLKKEESSDTLQEEVQLSSLSSEGGASEKEEDLIKGSNDPKTRVTDSDLQYYSKSTWIHIPTCLDDESKLSQSVSCETEETAWDFPSTFDEKCKYAVYCDLWNKGYHITNGSKFGSDYLVYPGEPSSYHSHYIIVVMPSSKQCNCHQLIAYGRLGNAVKKTVAFAIVNELDFSVKYQSISWAGME